MALITRVSRLFRADVHAVLDRIEEPDVLLRQAVREMEESLTGDAHRLKLLEHEHSQLNSRISDLDQALREVEEELDVCFAADQDKLARTLVRRKLEAQRLRKLTVQKHETLRQTIETLRAQLHDNRARLDNMRQKADLLSEERATGTPEPRWESPPVCVRDEDIEVAFLREKHKRTQS
ncbi:MAG: hypothetical protein AMJ69_03010 [Gammaproteobacteria bacterium SG8_47]|nr:MAG: hypothetical protein AMJ69_03010 [Gammaproteobacteria bacterium SG8_47]